MNSPTVVLDASALLCLMMSEPGAEKVEALMDGAVIGAVNYSEVLGKLVDRGFTANEIVSDISDLGIVVVDVDREIAEIAARMRPATREMGLSLGDRLCLALARKLEAEAVTTDRAWGRIASQIDVTVTLIR